MRHLLLVFAGLFVCTLAARADNMSMYLSFVGYNYVAVGDASKLTHPYTVSDRVIGSVYGMLGSSLQPKQSDIPFTISDFSFNDGVQTLDNTNASLDFNFQTNEVGAIGYYSFDVRSKVDPANDFIYVLHSATHNQTIAELNYGTYGRIEASGNLSVTLAPEPSSLVLLGTGVLGAAGIIRRRLILAS